MMNKGRLVWSCRGPSGAWRADSQMYPPDFWYHIVKEAEGWVVEVREVNASEQLGPPQRVLRDAKRLADQHHHTQIQARGDDEIKAYIARYPL